MPELVGAAGVSLPDPSADDYTWLDGGLKERLQLLTTFCQVCGESADIYQRGLDGVLILCLFCARTPGMIRVNRLIQAAYGVLEVLPAPDARTLALLAQLHADFGAYLAANRARLAGLPPTDAPAGEHSWERAGARSRIQRWWGRRALPTRPAGVQQEDWALFVGHVREGLSYGELGRRHGRSDAWAARRLHAVQAALLEGRPGDAGEAPAG